jgi:transcriptional pleiotropic repressor
MASLLEPTTAKPTGPSFTEHRPAGSLLSKTRQINRLLQRSENVEYKGIARVLSNVLGANVYITNRQGKVYGYAFVDDFECDLMLDKVINRGEFPRHYVNWLMRIDETRANLRSKTGMCAYEEGTKCMFNGKNTTVVPIFGIGERIGTLIVAKYDEEFTDDDLLLAEYGATVVGMEMLRDHAEKIEIEARKKATVQIAINTLSYSERKAAIAILTALPASEGLLVASKIADQVGITRSVIVNALRKFESAGVIESRSLGMKGTHIKVKNEYLLEEIERLRDEA